MKQTRDRSNTHKKLLNIDSANWNTPLLITGCARSGTSALTRALSSHDKFCIFNEYHLYYQSKYDFNVWHQIHRMRDDNPPPEKVSSNTATLKVKLLEKLPLPTSCQLTKNWLFDSLQNPVKIYGDKMPYKYLDSMHEVVEQYPEVKFLIILRDGRDVVASQIRHYNDAVKNDTIPEHWMKPSVQEAEYLWLRSARAWLNLRSNPPAPCLEVRYEQAVRSPETLAVKICDFVGIAYQEQDFRKFFMLYRPVNIDAWRDEIDKLEEQLSREFLDALAQLGYA
jgi:hypothetical protein